jgi:YesN/AraC family two-component response regulator
MESNTNPWNTFLHNNKNNNLDIKALSAIYKNKQSSLVTLHIDYIENLHNEINTLKQICDELKLHNNYLSSIIMCNCVISPM